MPYAAETKPIIIIYHAKHKVNEKQSKSLTKTITGFALICIYACTYTYIHVDTYTQAYLQYILPPTRRVAYKTNIFEKTINIISHFMLTLELCPRKKH